MDIRSKSKQILHTHLYLIATQYL